MFIVEDQGVPDHLWHVEKEMSFLIFFLLTVKVNNKTPGWIIHLLSCPFGLDNMDTSVKIDHARRTFIGRC